MIFASILFLNHSIDRHSSRNFPLNDSLVPFCQGFPGSMCAVSMFSAASHFRTARDTNSGPLSDLRCFVQHVQRKGVFFRRRLDLHGHVNQTERDSSFPKALAMYWILLKCCFGQQALAAEYSIVIAKRLSEKPRRMALSAFAVSGTRTDGRRTVASR